MPKRRGPRRRSSPRRSPRSKSKPNVGRGVNRRQSELGFLPPLPTILPSQTLEEQYVKSSLLGTLLDTIKSGGRGLSQSGVWGPTLRGLQGIEAPTSMMKSFERATGLRGAAEGLAKQAANRAMPSPFLWLLTPSLWKLFMEGASPPKT